MKIKRMKGVLGIGLSAGLIITSLASVFAVPVAAAETEWSMVNTPSWDDIVILPDSDIIDYDVSGDEGDTIYAILNSDASENDVGDSTYDIALVKSDDGGVTWSDITDEIQGAANIPEDFDELVAVSVAPDDEDWVTVAGYGASSSDVMVVASKDGGSNFSFAGDVKDTGTNTTLDVIYDMAVSLEVSDIHNIALAGVNNLGDGAVFRLKAGTWLTGSWADTSDVTVGTDYPGWDDADAVVAVAFSPNFDIDDTIVCISINDSTAGDDGTAYLQSGIWESDGEWNDEGGFDNAVEIVADGDDLLADIFMRCAGLALPADYDGSDPSMRAVFVYVNATNSTSGLEGGYVFRIDDGDVSEQCGPSGDPILASIDVHGDADTGKMMIGEYVQWDNDGEGSAIAAECCESVRVWHTEELDFCCPSWDSACKDPSGAYMALVMYTPDGEKEYATTSGSIDSYFGVSAPGELDESAFSVSLDDAVSFNQIGLIDTTIDYLSDVAVCPDCSVIYLSTINTNSSCGCDSIWRSYDDGDTWERVYHGDWTSSTTNALLLRLPCDTDEECCVVYMGVQNTENLYYTRDCGQCWNDPPSTKIDIQDFAVETENVVYVINDTGDFSMSTQYGRRWSDAEDIGLDNGHTIISCCNEGFIVVGGDNGDPVAWSDDGGDSWETTDDLPEGGEVHIACDPECENIIYAAVDGTGIFRTDITDGDWDDLNALDIDYTGIVVARTGGTLYAASDEIPADKDLDCEDRFGESVDSLYYSGVARNLDPCDTACCGTEDWDYLICGMGGGESTPDENFNAQSSSLRICGCLSLDTNSILWAIDTDAYDVEDGEGDNDAAGGLWSYEDCAAKHGPTLISPADESVLDCELCAGCGASPFTLKWERMCNACSYDIEIMDEDGNLIFDEVDIDITGSVPTYYVDDEAGLTCGETYTWHVREANTTCECIHSPWSETWTFTVAVGSSDAIDLLSPDEGQLGVPVSSVGFSWTSVPDADSYTFTLSPNANLTGALVSQDQGTTAYNYGGTLDYSSAYYWQVKAWKGSVLLTTSSIGVFNTAAEPEAPVDPVVVNETPAPVVEIPAAQNITPGWIYAVIGIGAALVVVVIVLIVRTRRP